MSWRDFLMTEFNKIMLGLLFILMMAFVVWAYRWGLKELFSWLTNTAGAILGALLTLITAKVLGANRETK